jgi:hypothetical protein
MKLGLITCLILFSFSISAFSQTEAEKFKENQLHSKYLSVKDLKEQFIKYDFSFLFTHTKNSLIYGFIGDNYQRIKVKFINVKKDTLMPDTYNVYGKSMVKNNIDQFIGTIKILNIRKLKNISYGVDNEYKNKGIKGEFIIIGSYNLAEDKKQKHAGLFNGICKSDFYLKTNNRIYYDDLELNADGYTNNQFVGEWAPYNDDLKKKCNWGDFRIPNSGDLDIGAGEFSPNNKYLKYGWQSVRDENKKLENAHWWE